MVGEREVTMQGSAALAEKWERGPSKIKSQLKAQKRNKPGMLLGVFPKAQLLCWTS